MKSIRVGAIDPRFESASPYARDQQPWAETSDTVYTQSIYALHMETRTMSRAAERTWRLGKKQLRGRRKTRLVIAANQRISDAFPPQPFSHLTRRKHSHPLTIRAYLSLAWAWTRKVHAQHTLAGFTVCGGVEVGEMRLM